MRRVFAIFISVVSVNVSLAQQISAARLMGEWQVCNYKSLVLIAPGMENERAASERKRMDLNRSKGRFTIDSNYIKTTNEFLEFEPCKFNMVHATPMEVNVVKNDYSAGYASSFDLCTDSSKVSDDFVALLDKNYSKERMTVFNTDSKVGYGAETLKICIVGNDKIALYRSHDVIVLKRKLTNANK